MNRPTYALLALAIGAFGIGTTEFLMMGVLPLVAADLGESLPSASAYITAYAVGVVLGAPTLTAMSTRWSPHRVLVGLMVLFALGNAGCALAPDHTALVAGRLVTALVHGAYFGTATIVARSLVPPGRAAQAISLVLAGLATANVVGVPAGTFIGQLLGWRVAFALVALLGVATIGALTAWVPRTDATRVGLRAELSGFRQPTVWLLLGVTMVGFSALFTVYSFIAPVLTDRAGFAPSSMTLVLAVFGGGTVVGSLVGGRLADRSSTLVLVGGLAATAVLLAAFTVTSGSRGTAVLTLAALGVVTFGSTPALQDRVIRAAGSGGSLVSAVNHGAFNIANAIGASLGAAVLGSGLGYTAPMWVGSAMAVAGLAVLAVALRVERHQDAQTARLTRFLEVGDLVHWALEPATGRVPAQVRAVEPADAPPTARGRAAVAA